MIADLNQIQAGSALEDAARPDAPPHLPHSARTGRGGGRDGPRRGPILLAAAEDHVPGPDDADASPHGGDDGSATGSGPATADRSSGSPIYMMSNIAPDFSFGVLRRHFSSRTNRAHEWIHRKLHLDRQVAPPPETPRWKPDCARHDVLLPDGVMDTFVNPALLAQSFEAEAEGDRFRKDLVIHVRLVAPPDRPLHGFWERVRRFAAEVLVREAGLPVILALHDPARTVARNPAPAHIHVMALARRLEPRGWGRTTDLACDAAHPRLAERWQAMP